MGKKAYLTEEPPHNGLALVDAISLQTFLSHDITDGMQKDFSRNIPLEFQEDKLNPALRIGPEALNKQYKDTSSGEGRKLSDDLKELLVSVDSDIIKAISRNQLQGRGIDQNIEETYLDGKKLQFETTCHNRALFQDIVPKEDGSVKITDVSLQYVPVWAARDGSSKHIMPDVSFLEERSYTYAWLPVADQITKYEKKLLPLSIPASDQDMGHLITTGTRDVTNKVTQAYTKYLSTLQDYIERKDESWKTYLHNLQNYIEVNKEAGAFSSIKQDFTNCSFPEAAQNGQKHEITNPDNEDRPYIFIYTDGKWIPQFFIDHDNNVKPASFRLHDGELQTVTTTDHKSTVQMVCDEEHMKTMLNGQLNLLGQNDLTPLTDNVSSFHLHIEFIRLSLEKIRKGQHTPKYKQKIAKQLFDKYFTAIENGSYHQTTQTSQKFLGLSKQLTKGAREDLTPLKNAFLTSIGGDPEYTQKINALFTKLENSQKSRLQRTVMATSRVLLNFLKLIFFPIVVIIKLATFTASLVNPNPTRNPSELRKLGGHEVVHLPAEALHQGMGGQSAEDLHQGMGGQSAEGLHQGTGGQSAEGLHQGTGSSSRGYSSDPETRGKSQKVLGPDQSAQPPRPGSST